MKLTLRLIGGKHAGDEIVVRREQFFIGRGEDCHFRPSSAAVSRRHCAIIHDENGVRICDLNSSNGTLVNGKRIENEQVLDSGDCVKVGPLEFAVLFVLEQKQQSIESADKSFANDATAAFDKEHPEDQIQSWLSDGLMASPIMETAELKVGDTLPHTQGPLSPPGTKPPEESRPRVSITEVIPQSPELSTPATDAPAKPPEDSSEAASTAIKGMIAQIEKNKRSRSRD